MMAFQFFSATDDELQGIASGQIDPHELRQDNEAGLEHYTGSMFDYLGENFDDPLSTLLSSTDNGAMLGEVLDFGQVYNQNQVKEVLEGFEQTDLSVFSRSFAENYCETLEDAEYLEQYLKDIKLLFSQALSENKNVVGFAC